MAYRESINPQALPLTGGTIQYQRYDSYSLNTLTGSGNLTGTITVSENPNDPQGNPLSPSTVQGLSYKIRYEGSVVYTASNKINVFGRDLTATEAMNTLDITATYLSSSWVVEVLYVKTPVTNVITATSGGGTKNLNFNDVQDYLVEGTATLSGSLVIQVDPALSNPTVAMTVTVDYQANLTLNGNSVTIFGAVLTAQQAKGGVIVRTTFDPTASPVAWLTTVLTQNPIRKNVGLNAYTWDGGAHTVALDVNLDKSVQQIIGSGSATGALAFTATGSPAEGEGFKILYQAAFTQGGGGSVTVFGVALTDYEMQTGQIFFDVVYSGGGWVVTKTANPQKLFGQTEEIVVPVSFETNEVGKIVVPVNYNFLLTNVSSCVSKVIAATDDGTIAIDISGGSTTPSSQTITQSSTVGTVFVTTITANNLGTAGQLINLTTSKVTAGGRCVVTLTLIRTP